MRIDGLTGLPTREELALLLAASTTPFAVFFDIDALVQLTHMCGYLSSDDAIIRVARIVRDRAAALGYPVFRIGGDEFLVVLEGGTHSQARAFARSVLTTVSTARIEYCRFDDPSRDHLALNAVVCRVSPRLGSHLAEAHDWFADQIWKAKQGDVHRFGVVADAGEGVPPWAF